MWSDGRRTSIPRSVTSLRRPWATNGAIRRAWATADSIRSWEGGDGSGMDGVAAAAVVATVGGVRREALMNSASFAARACPANAAVMSSGISSPCQFDVSLTIVACGLLAR